MRRALAFLTRLPGGRPTDSAAKLAVAVPWFPVVGALIGLFGAAGLLAARPVSSPLGAAAVSLASTAAVTGALHEDGLADTVDGLVGGRDPEQRRRILDDSRLGTFGVLALVLVTMAKAGALTAMADVDGRVALAALVIAHSLARTGTVVLLGVAPIAPGSGSGSALARAVGPGAVVAGVGSGGAVLTAGLVLVTTVEGIDVVAVVSVALAAVAGVAVVSAAVTWWARRRIGGVTGDILGAAEQVSEVVVLTAIAALPSLA